MSYVAFHSSLAPGPGGVTSIPPMLRNLVSPATGELTEEDPTEDGGAAQQSAQAEEELPAGDPGTVLEVKHLDEVLDTITGQWVTKATPVGQTSSTRKSGKYDCFAFTVVRRFTPASAITRGGKASTYNVTKWIEIHSDELRRVGAKVIGHVQGGASWTTKPLRVSDLHAPPVASNCQLTPIRPSSSPHKPS